MAEELTAKDIEQLILQEETPRMKCLKKVQADHLACLATAGKDEKKKSACNTKLAEDLAKCPPPSP